MYNPQIKDKYSLIDLTRYGTKARKHVHSDVLIGTHPPFSIFKEGDILDANATLNLMQSAYDQDKVYNILSARIDEVEETVKNMDLDFESVKEEVEQTEQSVVDLEEKHDQDMQEMKQYITQEIDKNTAKVVYDGLEENLLVYNVKHG